MLSILNFIQGNTHETIVCIHRKIRNQTTFPSTCSSPFLPIDLYNYSLLSFITVNFDLCYNTDLDSRKYY